MFLESRFLVLSLFFVWSISSCNESQNKTSTEPNPYDIIKDEKVARINTYLTGDWTANEEVVAAIARGAGLDADVVRAQPLYEFVLDPSSGLTDLAQEVFLRDGVLSYSEPIPESDLVDRSFVEEARG